MYSQLLNTLPLQQVVVRFCQLQPPVFYCMVYQIYTKEKQDRKTTLMHLFYDKKEFGKFNFKN